MYYPKPVYLRKKKLLNYRNFCVWFHAWLICTKFYWDQWQDLAIAKRLSSQNSTTGYFAKYGLKPLWFQTFGWWFFFENSGLLIQNNHRGTVQCRMFLVQIRFFFYISPLTWYAFNCISSSCYISILIFNGASMELWAQLTTTQNVIPLKCYDKAVLKSLYYRSNKP